MTIKSTIVNTIANTIISNEAPFVRSWADITIRAWEMEEATNANRIDSVGNGDLIHQAGSTTQYSPGKLGTYAVQPNSNGYFNCANNADLRTTSSFAVSFWANLTLISGPAISASNTNDYSWRIAGISSPQSWISFWLTNSATSWDLRLDVGAVGTFDVYRHYLCQWNSVTGLAEVYQDNVLKDSGNIAAIRGGSAAHLFVDPGGWGGFFNGNIVDSMLVFNDTLTADERAQLYNAGVGRTYAQLIAL